MNYLALGDSISIDDYTEQVGGGAVSQFARLIGADMVEDLTQDGCTTSGVLMALGIVTSQPNIVTVTAGGNDLLQLSLIQNPANLTPRASTLEEAAQVPLDNLSLIADQLSQWNCPVILNTIRDPTDGDDLLVTQLGIPIERRSVYQKINLGIKDLAQKHGFLIADLEVLFRGHGIASEEPWFVLQIEPNLAGATAIAHLWHELYQSQHPT